MEARVVPYLHKLAWDLAFRCTNAALLRILGVFLRVSVCEYRSVLVFDLGYLLRLLGMTQDLSVPLLL